MGLFDKLKEKSEGVFTAAKPAEGVAPAEEAEVRSRLLAIEGKGITAGEDEGEVVIAWAAKVAAAGGGGAGVEYRYRAIRVSLDPAEHEAKGLCFKTDSDAEVHIGGSLGASKSWERGQHVGAETMRVLAWLGPHATEGGADEQGYKFSWGELRKPVVEAVTGAGWTYKPKAV